MWLLKQRTDLELKGRSLSRALGGNGATRNGRDGMRADVVGLAGNGTLSNPQQQQQRHMRGIHQVDVLIG